MGVWNHEEQIAIADAEELNLQSLGEDGALGKVTIMWVVSVGDDLYVRAVRGPRSEWFRGTQQRHTGRISSGGVEKDVVFVDVPADDPLHAAIDRAYRTKYRNQPQEWVEPTVTEKARSATLKIEPLK